MNTTKGLVAFFDILGYQEFLQSNEPLAAIEIIRGFLKKVHELRTESFPTFFGKETADNLKKLMDTFTHLTVSDSMLIAFQADMENEADYLYSLFTFSLYCSALHKEFFISGLPVRGAIEYGNFIISPKDGLFAEVPIVKAYKLSNQLSLSACVVGESALPKSYPPTIHAGFVKYRIPMRNGQEQDGTLLAPILGSTGSDVNLESISDVKQFVVESFSNHNKTIGLEVLRKVENTEMFFRFCKARYQQEPFPKFTKSKKHH
jgi:hypothetical protein